MAITTLSGAISGLQWERPFAKQSGSSSTTRWISFWGVAGHPAAGAFDTTLAGVTLSSSSSQVTGQIPFTDPASGNTYLSKLKASMGNQGLLILADRLWHNGGFASTSNTAQTINSGLFPARDNAGTTNGDGVLLGLEISSAMGAATPTVTVTYTNQSGIGSRSATNIFATVSSSAAAFFFPIGLQAGDSGVQSVTDLTLSASWLSGTMNLVAYRVLGVLDLSQSGVSNTIDCLTGGFQRMYNGSVPFFLLTQASTGVTASISGSVAWSQG